MAKRKFTLQHIRYFSKINSRLIELNYNNVFLVFVQKREYPDGTVKILHDDGKLETRYSSGRIRIRDNEGKLLHDSQNNVPIEV